MSGFTFTRATKSQARARIALIGPAGSGKTYSALAIAHGLGERVAVIDTEHGSAAKYASGEGFEFDVLELTSFAPATYVQAMQAAEAAGYDVLVVDSLSHAWMGKDGALEQVDRAAKRTQSGSTFGAWRDVTPQHNALVEAMLACRCHLVVTMRAKTEYVQEKDDRTGKTSVRKIGLAPVQRDGLEYEFDVVGDIDGDHNLVVTKTRCRALDGAVVNKPGAVFASTIKAWLTDGAPVVEPAAVAAVEPVSLPQPAAPDPAVAHEARVAAVVRKIVKVASLEHLERAEQWLAEEEQAGVRDDERVIEAVSLARAELTAAAAQLDGPPATMPVVAQTATADMIELGLEPAAVQ